MTHVRLSIYIAFITLMLAAIAQAAQTADWPGIWAEAESGKGDAHSSSIQYASGHSAVDMQTQGGKWSLDINSPAPLPGAILYVRYAREPQGATGNLDLYIGPPSAAAINDTGVRLIGHAALPATGRLSDWRWARVAAGDIEAGPHRLFLSIPAGQTAGYIDMLGFVPGSTKGLWQPPNDVLVGFFRDVPRVTPAFELTGVQGHTFGDLLPANAGKVSFSLNVKNNLFAANLDLKVHGELRADDGKTLILPAAPSQVAPDSTQRIDYGFALPGTGHFEMTLIAEAEGVSVRATRWLTTTPCEPVWVTSPGTGKEPLRLSGPGKPCSINLDLPAAMPCALVYVAYHRSIRDESQGSEAVDVYLGPADAADINAAGIRKLGPMTLDPLSRFGPQERWACINAGELAAGKYRLFLALPASSPPAAGSQIRPAINLIKQVGLVPDVDHGRWVPPVESLDSKGVVTVEEARLLKESVHVESLTCEQAGQLFLGSQVLDPNAKDLPFHLTLASRIVTQPTDEVKYWEIWNEPWVGGWTWRTGTAQDYRDMCRMLWDRIKPEMPDVMLVGGGSTPYDRDVLFALNSDNAGYVDGVSSHPYGKPDTNHPAFAAVEAAMLKKFARGGGPAGIWATELGTAAYMFDPLPRPQADLMVRTMAPLYLLPNGAGETPIRLFFFASQYGSDQFSGGEHNLWMPMAAPPRPGRGSLPSAP